MGDINVNGDPVSLDDDEAGAPLLWILREKLDLTGTKYGCGIARCGACTVHVDNVPVRSCVMPAGDAVGKRVTTIEGLTATTQGHGAVQTAWLEFSVPQCGYCQSGQIMSAVALLRANPSPSQDEVDIAMAGNLCRCGTYCAIRRAIERAKDLIKNGMEP